MFKKPKVGTYVRVTRDYSVPLKMHLPGQRIHTNVGKVVDSADWEGENTFALLTDDPKMPIKTIELKWVTVLEAVKAAEVHLTNTGMKEQIKAAAEGDRTFAIKSSSNSGTYTVTKSKMSWTCDCIAGSRGRRCKHVAEAMAIEAKEKTAIVK